MLKNFDISEILLRRFENYETALAYYQLNFVPLNEIMFKNLFKNDLFKLYWQVKFNRTS